jgi:hypothetical protein
MVKARTSVTFGISSEAVQISGSKSSFLGPESIPMTAKSQQRSFRARHLNVLNERQKSAHRRKRWVRKVDPATNRLRWINVHQERKHKRQRGEKNGLDDERGREAAKNDMDGDLVRQLSMGVSSGNVSLGQGFVTTLDSLGRISAIDPSSWQHVNIANPDINALDLEEVAAMSFRKKSKWFESEVGKLQEPIENGYVLLKVRRGTHLLRDSFEQLFLLPSQHLHKVLRIEFEDEPAVDFG